MRFLTAVLLMIMMWVVFPAMSGPAQAACTAPSGSAGVILYNGTHKVFQYCNDTSWIRMNQPGTGSGGCTAPAAAEGEMIYNEDARVLQGCAGNVHKAFGPVDGDGGWVAVATAQTSGRTCGIKSNGKMLCWGTQMQGEMGLNDGSPNADYSTPQFVTGNSRWNALSTNYTQTCGIKTDGTLWCWGADNYGQLGNGAVTGSKQAPEAVTGGGTWNQVTTGIYHTCGIKTDGSAWCWGYGANGKLGNAGTANQPDPVAVSTAGVSGTSWIRISAGSDHTCGIRDDNTAWCWGSGFNGARGDGTTTSSQTTPVIVSGGFTWTEIYAGSSYACGIRSTGEAYCWGTGANGWIGNGSTANRTTPTLVSGGGTWLSLSVGNAHTCGIKSDNLAYCWGSGSSGQLGNNAITASQTTPVQVTIAGGPWVQISAGNRYTCGRTSSGIVNCWGSGWGGERGDGIETEAFYPRKVSGSSWRELSPSQYHTCGVKTDGTGWCWGENQYGQLGNNSSVTEIPVPTAIAGGGTWLKVSAGDYHTCGIKSDNLAYCWGLGNSGQRGNGAATPTNQLTPVLVTGGYSWKDISAGFMHTCGIQTDDTLWCWGDNGSGEVGDNTTVQKNAPVQVSGGGAWQKVAATGGNNCGTKTDGTLWCWGYGGDGNLGQGAFVDSLIPVAVSGGGTWKEVHAQGWNPCGVKTDNTGWCWGYGGDGQLGDGLYTDSNVPAQLGGEWLSVSGGAYNSCGVMTDGSLWCWGEGGPVLGNNDQNYDYQPSPYPVWGGGVWKKAFSGDYHACAIDKNDDAWCWGYTIEAMGIENFPVSLTAQSMSCPGLASAPGTIVYNSDFNVLQYCDGASWVAVRN